MKRILTFLIAACMTLGMAAQQHFKFMGIPLDGTINSFQQKLQAKGMKPDAEMNRILGVGIRAFEGRFSGYDANVAVFYDEKTKIVYKAKVVIQAGTSKLCEQYYKDLKGNLVVKYGEGEVDTEEDHESCFFTVLSPEVDTICGFVGISVSKSESYPYDYKSVGIEYYDIINTDKHENSKLDDL